MKTFFALTSWVALGCVMLSVNVSAPAAAPAAAPLSVQQEPLPGRLLAPGDRVGIDYKLDSRIASPIGSLYVRNDLMRGFERLPLRLKGDPMKGGATLRTSVPLRLLRGHKLFYYAVVRDSKGSRSTTVPTAGARAPQTAWILEKPVVVLLGTHRFGHLRAPGTIVARARPDQVGWDTGPEFQNGPQTFQVGRDGSIWLQDSFNNRLLGWNPGRPDSFARTVPLPGHAGEGDVAAGPAGTLYVSAPGDRQYAPLVFRLSARGNLWQTPLPNSLRGYGQLPLRVAPDGTLFCSIRPDVWMPVTTPGGRPLPVSKQLLGIQRGSEPVAGRLRLVAEMHTWREGAPSHEGRLALIDRRGQVVRAWRVLSRTEIFFPAGYTTPELVGGDPVVILDVQTGASAPDFKWEREVVRLGPRGARTHFALSRPAVYGETYYADLRIEPDGKLYQLATSLTTGVVINRYLLGRSS